MLVLGAGRAGDAEMPMRTPNIPAGSTRSRVDVAYFARLRDRGILTRRERAAPGKDAQRMASHDGRRDLVLYEPIIRKEL